MATLLSFGLGPEDSGELYTEIARESGFLSASTKTTLPANGKATPVIGKATAAWVERGAKKAVSNPTPSTNVIQPYTVAVIIPVHRDLATDVDGLTEAIQSEGVSALKEAVDNTIAGFLPVPGDNFGTLKNAAYTQVNGRKGFIDALKKAAKNGKRPESAVITAALYYDLLAVSNDKNGNPEFVINDANNTINNIPFYLMEGTESIGFLGAFKSQSRWGTVDDIQVKVSEDASITIDGELVSTFETNLVACRVEARYGFNYRSITDFSKIGVAATDPTAPAAG